MRKPCVFLICGYARAGKDTAAEAIESALPGAKVLHFADLLKSAVNRYFTALGIESVNVKEQFDKVRFRDLLVEAGKAARSVDRDVFANDVADRARYAILSGQSVVIPDWRYLNELEAVQRKVRAPIVRILIERRGQAPANEEEARSIDAIVGCVTFDHVLSFDSGDIGAIRETAAGIAWQHATEVPAA